jgi:hypothetical protein
MNGIGMNRYTSINTSLECSMATLHQLVGRLDCSLARYLSYARPWVRRPLLLLEAVARRLSDEHASLAARIAHFIDGRRGIVRPGGFPIDFTYFNDVSLEHMAPRLLEQQRALVASAEQCALNLRHDPEAFHLLSRVARSLRQYAALLEELVEPDRSHGNLVGNERHQPVPNAAAAFVSTTRPRRQSVEPQSAA